MMMTDMMMTESIALRQFQCEPQAQEWSAVPRADREKVTNDRQ